MVILCQTKMFLSIISLKLSVCMSLCCLTNVGPGHVGSLYIHKLFKKIHTSYNCIKQLRKNNKLTKQWSVFYCEKVRFIIYK